MVSLLPLIYFLPATRGNLVISPDDGVIFNIPVRAAVANLIHAGYLPLWNPYIFCGMPLFGAAQAGVLFPLNWFYLIFSLPVATNLMMLSTYMVAALGAYLYARRSGSSLAGAALTSVVWQWSGFLIGQIGHTNITQSAALLPWILWAVDGYGESGKRRRGVLLAALVAVQLFAGHQQTAVYALLVASAYAVVMWRAGHSSSAPRSAYLWSLVLIAAGLALAAVQILPTLELLRNSLRADASYDFFSSFSMPRRFLWTFLAPYVVGGGDGHLFRAPYVGPAYYAEYVGYVGLGTIALALLAVVLKRDARTKFWAGLAVAAIILALGRYAPFGFYKLIYAVPVLNLFRVPARHLMEVEFAFAVLAGRGLTAIIAARDRARMLRWVLGAGVIVLVLTCLAITLGRPANFQLGRAGPVTILRAPELFLPPVLAALSAWALYMHASRQRRGTFVLLLVVLALDLNLAGQSSGWRVGSPKWDFEWWSEPAIVRFLREREGQGEAAPYRVLTNDQLLDLDQPIFSSAPAAGWIPSLQPDIYMMYGLENAAGYDGFGLARYGRLAGDMKVWGDFTDAERTLRSESREIDLLNVRYLLARLAPVAAPVVPAAKAEKSPAPTRVYGGQTFAQEGLNLPGIVAGERFVFDVPPIEADHIALLTALACSETVPDGTIVAEIRLHAQDDQTFAFQLRAGDHTSEWAYDRADVRPRMKHRRAPVATSYAVGDAPATFEAHSYVSAFTLPRKAVVISGEITLEQIPGVPRLTLSLNRLSLADGGRAFPLQGDGIRKESAAPMAQSPTKVEGNETKSPRWKRIAEVGGVAVLENSRMLPRAWLVTGELVATGEEELRIIRAGKTSDGTPWDPLEKALVESRTGIAFPKGKEPPGRADVARCEPNRVDVRTESGVATLLILAENYYPGWRTELDEKSVEMLRVNYNQRGVALSAGTHSVTFFYQPRSVLLGLVISLLALASLVWWAILDRSRGDVSSLR